MKRVLALGILFLIIHTSIYSQSNFSIGISGAAVIPQFGTTGFGSSLSFSYKPIDNIAVTASAGFSGWGNSQVNHYTHTIGYISISSRYILNLANFYPYISGNIDYAFGRYRYEPLEYDENSGEWSIRRHEFITLSEILSGVGIGFLYPISQRFSFDTGFNIILTTQTNSLFYSRFSFGMNYSL